MATTTPPQILAELEPVLGKLKDKSLDAGRCSRSLLTANFLCFTALPTTRPPAPRPMVGTPKLAWSRLKTAISMVSRASAAPTIPSAERQAAVLFSSSLRAERSPYCTLSAEPTAAAPWQPMVPYRSGDWFWGRMASSTEPLALAARIMVARPSRFLARAVVTPSCTSSQGTWAAAMAGILSLVYSWPRTETSTGQLKLEALAGLIRVRAPYSR